MDDGGSNCAGYFEIKIWRGGEMSLYFEVVSSGIHLMGGRCTVWRGEGLTKKAQQHLPVGQNNNNTFVRYMVPAVKVNQRREMTRHVR